MATKKQQPKQPPADPFTQIAIKQANEWINNAKLSDLINFAFDRLVNEKVAEMRRDFDAANPEPKDGE